MMLNCHIQLFQLFELTSNGFVLALTFSNIKLHIVIKKNPNTNIIGCWVCLPDGPVRTCPDSVHFAVANKTDIILFFITNLSC